MRRSVEQAMLADRLEGVSVRSDEGTWRDVAMAIVVAGYYR